MALLWLHVAFIAAYALSRGYSPSHAVLEAGIVAAPAVVGSWPAAGRRVRTLAAGFGLMSSSAVLVHLSGGLIEMHFHFFVMVTLVALYQDWLPFLTAIGYVLVHHGLMGSLDPASVFNHPAAQANPWKWAGVHALFVMGTSAACLVTWRLNENLHESERQARLVSESARARLALLAEVSAVTVLTSSLDPEQILKGVAQRIIPSAGDFCLVDLLDEDGATRRVAVATAFLAAESAAAHLEQGGPIAEALAGGITQVLDIEGDLASQREDPGSDQHTSIVSVPLRGRHAVVGCLTVGTINSSGRRILADDVPLIEEVARRASVAVENARLYKRQRTVAETLQHSLLPERLPEVPGIRTSARYIPGGPEVEVGGDWYDVIPLPDSSIALAMGDVVGRGERAASLMGQLRNAARAYALDRKSPAEVAELLNRMLIDLGGDSMATMIYAIVDLDTGTLRFVNAGHPPPLVLGPSPGDAQFLENGGGIPLGAVGRARYADTVTTLQPGSTLILYTDGLVENRSTPLDTGLNLLREAASGAPEDFEHLCDHILAESVGNSGEDDVAVLALRLVELGDRLTLNVPREPHLIAPLRSTVRRWLSTVGASERETYEVVAATGEACANAIQHAVGPSVAHFEVGATHAAGRVTITVKDRGRWRPARATPGGRGLDIMRAFMDEVEIDTGAGGTAVTMTRRLHSHKTEGVGA